MTRHEYVIDWIRRTLGDRFPGGLLPREMELEATRHAIDWAWWSGTEVVREVVDLEPRECFPGGPVRPHWVLRKGGDDGR